MSLAREILKQKRLELLAQVAELRKGIRDLDAALDTLGEPGKASFSQIAAGTASPINAAIIEAISQGNNAPSSIFLFIHENTQIDTSKNSISTRLSKLKNEGLIDHDGQGWVLASKAEGSGASASEPSNSELGPVTGRGTVFPATPPEGSIPSGSTAPHLGEGPKPVDLDEEIPF